MKVILGVDPLLSPLTGIGHYTRSLALALLQQPSLEELQLFALGKFFPHALLHLPENIEQQGGVAKASTVSALRTYLATLTPAVWAYEKLIPIVDRIRLAPFKDYLFHAPNFFVPVFDGPKVVTFHDLSTILYPQYHPAVRVALANRQMAIAVESDAHIICDSQFIAAEVVQYFGVPESRVSKLHLAAAEEYQPRDASQCAQVLEQFDVGYKQFFLFVSTIEPRKNLMRLLDAYECYVQRTVKPLPLVVVGGHGWSSQKEHQRLTDLQLRGLVRYQGYLAQNIVHQLYSAARALVYPSIYEGFGLPVLEAMQSGAAVITSENSSMQEIAEDAAYYVNPNDTDSISSALVLLHEDENKLSILREQGLKRAMAFSWQQCAAKTLAVYQHVVDKHKA
uniref:Mannosyltransferase n=1 Tax=Rheinheimera sp. BAL341 TaxID=1708203 RepID=A0A486XVG9_9GAMM